MVKPIIGVSGSVIIEEKGLLLGIERAYVNNDYLSSVEKAGGIPIILPVVDEEETIKRYIDMVDGLILSGGHDVNSILYGQEPMGKLTKVWPKRDKFDGLLIKYALKANKPILGICRGMQIINVVFGGSLYQDMSYMETDYLKHQQETNISVPTHTINVEKGSVLHQMLGDNVLVNTLHHQAIKDLGHGFTISARSADGIIEAIENMGDNFIMGLQFHPEMLTSEYDYALNIFKKFIEVSKK